MFSRIALAEPSNRKYSQELPDPSFRKNAISPLAVILETNSEFAGVAAVTGVPTRTPVSAVLASRDVERLTMVPSLPDPIPRTTSSGSSGPAVSIWKRVVKVAHPEVAARWYERMSAFRILRHRPAGSV